MKFVNYLSWSLRAALFAALFLFAVRNTDPVTLRFYFDQAWQMPLIAALLMFFAFGAALGVLACLSRLLRQRRQVVALKRELRARGAAGRSPPATPP
ncbi:MAG: LapA family protein [Burkholderiales bacterium]